MLVRATLCTLVVALTALLLAGRTEGVPPSANPAREAGLLAYEATTEGIFTIRPDGTGNRRIVPDGVRPAWSPDGTRLLYELYDGSGGLWSAHSDGTDARLIKFGASDGAWSPSGRRVAFASRSGYEDGRVVREIWTAAHDGSGGRRLQEGTEPDWIAGTRRIAFIAPSRSWRRGISSRISTMRRDGSDVRVLLGDAKGYRSDLEVSQNGRKIAFRETKNSPGYQPSVLRIISLRTGRTTTIPLRKTGVVGALEWTPGGRRIAYFATFPTTGLPSFVYTIRPDGTGRKLLFTLPLNEEQRGLTGEALSWQPAQ